MKSESRKSRPQMDLGNQYNARSPGVKRLMREAWEMREPSEELSAAPVADNLFEWHFTIRGAIDTDFEGGVYHGRILFPTEYPMKPPNIILLTPNGRFEINKKICLSISGHHPETWQPSWCVRTALLALIAFMPTPGNSTVGALDYPKEERQLLARKSRSWECPDCGNIQSLLLPIVDKNDTSSSIDKNSTVKTVVEKTTDSSVMNPSPSPEVEVPTILASCISISNEPGVTEKNPDVCIPHSEVSENSSSSGPPNTPTIDHAMLTSLNHCNLFQTISPNFSMSKVTVSVIVALIALILYRRLFLLN